MSKAIISFISGLIFSIGLVLSGMTNPAIVRGFLDLFGNWNYSLVFVMGGAVIFNLISFTFLRNKKPFFSKEKYLPLKKEIDAKLILGSILFGVGWGLLGICPGPGIVNLVTFSKTSFIFIGAMLFGMFLFFIFNKKKA